MLHPLLNLRELAEEVSYISKLMFLCSSFNYLADQLKFELNRYLHYCRTECNFRLSESDATLLQKSYVKIRQDMRQQTNETGEVTTPIIVRSHVATEEDVKEAIRLFTMSTMDAARSGIHQQISLTPEMENEIKRKCSMISSEKFKKKDNFKNPLYIENLMEEYVTSFWVG
ncbi:DNA replication licensing factor MCM5-like isoform X2 [Arachis hypogaea]|uniref:DNA replication licensing factor MCM5-like isoform X2 n=1 Tax=Arachis hypogaea TaxID=3818 RepID=UPI003B210257